MYWLDKILAFSVKAVNKPGRQDAVADAIWRRPDFVALMMWIEGGGKRRKESSTADWSQQYDTWADFKELRRQSAVTKETEGERTRRQFYIVIETIDAKRSFYG